ncbi:MAG: IS21 family transposase [Fidelibacterota bacterium]
MDKIREIIRLKKEAQLSERVISRALNVSRPVVKQYVDDINRAGLDYAAIKAMDDDALLEILEGGAQSRCKRFDILRAQFESFAKELKRPGVTLQLLWREYLAEHPAGYSYTQFCYHYQVWRNTSALTMHMPHKAGDKMFVDFTGKKLSVVDLKTGKIKEMEVFVAVLGASQLTYVEAVPTQRKDDWIAVNRNTLHYFGGVPGAIVPDCLKSAVTSGNKYEPDINPEYQDFARHYQTTILPARPHHPKDKALVEGAVKIVYAWIFAVLRNRIFYSLKELNEAIIEELKKYNNKPMQKLKASRKELFDDIEKKELRPLPQEKYATRHFKLLKAQFNYHVYFSEDKHYYSVPYRYRGSQIRMIYTESVIELFYKNRRIAFHKRDRKANGYTTIKEHMPAQHRFVSDWNPQKFIKWAQHLGDDVRTVIEHVLARRQHPEQAFKTCMGILNLEKKFDKDRLNKACGRAVSFQNFSYKGIKNILENRLEEYQNDLFEQAPQHENIRGSRYFGQENNHGQ